ncbi:3-isopropylmalate dehydratase small subunit [Alicyclobacillus cellulosilyticus]|uniref:3-isopropylmalate dehydratase small subunit n=1 Tax=Alicyclobacillus cellulosilyticus TaxID=1003997 RepID=A0A917NJF1_9BACL|nr:3-isopropylmalate dehydratase small subunit [Alicyclobacillus cellulosilyticus]GGJ02228.1 3-isopropylmalate dehydratase small subunit [Alicyclobacillus cellulosilyticus]
MEPLIRHNGLVAVLDRVNVDTDQIIPKQFLKRIERSGFGQFLFYDWRYLPDGSLNPDFELNQPRFQGATILLTRDNFGCGSSREHAAWALLDYGFRVILAPSFADIFHNNCYKNGILPIVLPAADIDTLFERARQEGYRLTVDLEQQVITDDAGLTIPFQIDPYRRQLLMEGLDDIGVTLKHEAAIAAYEERRKSFPHAAEFAG